MYSYSSFDAVLPFGTLKPSQPCAHCFGRSGVGTSAGLFAARTDSATLPPWVRPSVKNDGSIAVPAGVCALVQTLTSKFATGLEALGAM